MARPFVTILAFVIALSPLPSTAKNRPARDNPHTSPSVRAADLPLSFEEREPSRLYVARAGDLNIAVRPTVVEFGGSVRFALAGARRASRLSGADRLPGVANYLVGNDPKNWRTRVPTFAGVRCDNVYPGIDAVYRGEDLQLVCDFHVAPHANPGAIVINIEGVNEVSISTTGALVARTSLGEVRQDAPVVYQESPSGRVLVDGRFELRGANRYGFAVGAYDHSRPLTIDPTVSFTYSFGGDGNTFLSAAAMDGQGNGYFAGSTSATNLPTAGGIDATLGGESDAVIVKLDANGQVQYLTYLGGSSYDSASGIAVDEDGAVYVTGLTGISTTDDFPVTTGAAQTVFGGASDAYVAKLAPDGASLAYSTYLGGPMSYDGGNGIAVDRAGNAYVCGGTSQHFPVVNAIQPQPSGAAEGFVAKLNAAGSAVMYATYLGGHGDDTCTGISVTNDGGVAVSGFTTSTDFPTVRPTQAANGGSDDAFVAVLNAAGSALSFATYLGGSDNDLAYGVGVDAAGHVFGTGSTSSPNLPVVNAVDSSHCGESTEACPDGFVFEIDPSAGTVVYCTYLGGGGFDQCLAIAVDSSGAAYVTGSTTSQDFPSVDPIPGGSGGGSEVFVTRIVPGGGSIDFADIRGGTGNEGGYGIAVDPAGTTALVAFTGDSSDFPAARGGAGGRQAPVERGGVLGLVFGNRPIADISTDPFLFLSAKGERRGVLIVYHRNRGPDAATDVAFTIDLPCVRLMNTTPDSRYVFDSVPEPGGETVGIRGRFLKPLKPGEVVTVVLTLMLPDEALDCVAGHEVYAKTRVTASSIDPDPSDNVKFVSALVRSYVDQPILTWQSAPGDGEPPAQLQLFSISGSNPPKGTKELVRTFPSPEPRSQVGAAHTSEVATTATLSGYKVYVSSQPNVQPVPANLFTTTPPTQTDADVSGAPAGSYFVVTAVFDDGAESEPSNEVGGVLPTITSVTVSTKKITAVGSGFSPGETVLFGGVPFASAAKLKKNNTKLVQKGATAIGQTATQLLQSLEAGSSVVILFIDPKGNGVGYVYTK